MAQTQRDEYPKELVQYTKAEIENVPGVWDVDELEEAEKVRKAIETVREDHSETVTFKSEYGVKGEDGETISTTRESEMK